MTLLWLLEKKEEVKETEIKISQAIFSAQAEKPSRHSANAKPASGRL